MRHRRLYLRKYTSLRHLFIFQLRWVGPRWTGTLRYDGWCERTSSDCARACWRYQSGHAPGEKGWGSPLDAVVAIVVGVVFCAALKDYRVARVGNAGRGGGVEGGTAVGVCHGMCCTMFVLIVSAGL